MFQEKSKKNCSVICITTIVTTDNRTFVMPVELKTVLKKSVNIGMFGLDRLKIDKKSTCVKVVD